MAAFSDRGELQVGGAVPLLETRLCNDNQHPSSFLLLLHFPVAADYKCTFCFAKYFTRG
jgi:hypothetical protein